MRIAFPLVSIVVPLCLISCGRNDGKAAMDAARANLAAMQSGDVEGFRATTHPASALFEIAEPIVRQAAEAKMACEFEECDVVSQSPDEIRVRFVQRCRSGDEHSSAPGSRVTGVFVLQRDESAWKIRETIISRVDYL